MKRKLYYTAIISSPIIAIYGGSPFYIFDKISLSTLLGLTSALTINVFVFWMLHIYFALNYPKQNKVIRFSITYLANVAFRLVFFFIDPLLDIKPPEFAYEYIAYPLLTSFALNAIIMVMVNSIVTSYKKIQTEKELQELKLQNSEAQKQILLQQLHPHFLFNSLSTLKALISENVQVAEDYTVKLSEFLRYSIQAHQNEMISLEKEIHFVQDYIDLQKIRFDNAFEYSINISDDLLQRNVPVLAIQTLVENIFKHNYFTQKNKLEFTIESIGTSIKVSNTKTSIKVTERTKTGLQNLNKRFLLLMNEPIKIEDTEQFFTVTIPILP